MNIKIAFKIQQYLSTILFNVKDKTPPYKKSGVYKLSCDECNRYYIGQTGRNFHFRYVEYEAAFRLRENISNFAIHFLETTHRFPDINKLGTLYLSKKSHKLNFLEAIEIYKHNNNPQINLFNDHTDLGTSTLFSILQNLSLFPHKYL